jgi:hypothetical protein
MAKYLYDDKNHVANHTIIQIRPSVNQASDHV